MKPVSLDRLAVARSIVYRGMPQYPARLSESLGDQAPASLWTAGSAELLSAVDAGQRASVALAVSVASPASIAEAARSLVLELSEAGAVFVGGFHSPLERLCLKLLVAASRPVIICLARTLTGMRIPHDWQQPLLDGNLLLVSASGQSQKRPTQESVRVRNACVAALAGNLLVPHAASGSKTEALCRNVLGAGKPVWTVDDPASGNLVAFGAKRAMLGMAREILSSVQKSLGASAPASD
ncbi:MAG: DNA-processing protein DprA [Acidobacteria bacterium]|nr:DNA-processing protein DprA [Acidobacteriota bacterium]MCI0621184.1 DNA-processing protein DprA [Acidobacteriota bacterium]MCI0719805.1 DNA-processing protein DprA [Acidobacteriota bacterium]